MRSRRAIGSAGIGSKATTIIRSTIEPTRSRISASRQPRRHARNPIAEKRARLDGLALDQLARFTVDPAHRIGHFLVVALDLAFDRHVKPTLARTPVDDLARELER